MAQHIKPGQTITYQISAQSASGISSYYITLASLPDDLIIAILEESLHPWDLVAVGQTCRKLHTCTKVKTVWKLAWSRAGNVLPPMPLPSLSIPHNELDNLTLDRFPEPPPTTCRQFPGLPLKPRHVNTSSLPDYAASFHQIACVQNQICKSKVAIRPLINSLYTRLTKTSGSGMDIVGEGSLVLFWNAENVHIFDIRHNMDYKIPMGVYSVAAETFLFEGVEGVLLAVVRKPDQYRSVELFFQPFSTTDSPLEGPPATRRLGVMTHQEDSALMYLRFSGHRYLIMVDKRGLSGKTSLQVLDLVEGKTFRILLSHYVYDAAVHDNRILVLSISPSRGIRSVMAVALKDLHENHDQSRAPERMFNMPRASGFYGFSARLSPGPTNPQTRPLFWYEGTEVATLAVIPFQLDPGASSSAVSGAQYSNWSTLSTTSVFPHFLENESCAPSEEQSRVRSRFRSTDTLLSLSSASTSLFSSLRSSSNPSPLPRENPRTFFSKMGGGERVLTSLYSSRANETGLVLSEYSHSLKTIVHRPVYMEGESEDANVKKSWWMRRTPPNQTKLFRMRRMPDSNFYINNIKWSEISGIVLMEIIDIKENVARIALFEFC